MEFDISEADGHLSSKADVQFSLMKSLIEKFDILELMSNACLQVFKDNNNNNNNDNELASRRCTEHSSVTMAQAVIPNNHK